MILIDYFKSLPMEITSNILSRLPVELVLECKSVCKNWRNILRHPSFSKLHFSQQHLNGESGYIAFTIFEGKYKDFHFQYFEYDEDNESTPIERIRRMNLTPPIGASTDFHGSYNGLVCFSQEKTCICNPITGEYLILPEIKKSGMDYGVNGFGYVPSINEYKVVRVMFKNYFDRKSIEVYVYTLGSGHGWRHLGKFNFEFNVHWEDGVFANGALNWLDYRIEKVIPFDLAEEKFCEHLSLPLPPDDDDRRFPVTLAVLDGWLSFAVIKRERWKIWLLKKKNDSHSLDWRQEFKVYGSVLFAITKSYNVLTYDGHCIRVQDPEASKSKIIWDFDDIFHGVFPHKNTLLSLKELGEVDTKIMEPVEIAKTESLD